MIEKSSRSIDKIRKINIFYLILLSTCAFAVSFFATDLWAKVVFNVLLFILMCAFGQKKSATKIIIIYAIAQIWLYVNLTFAIPFPSPMFFAFIIQFVPILMAVYLLVQAPSGKLTAGLRKVPLPSKITLMVIVILRFMPTIINEVTDVKDAMRTRGFLRSPARVLIHPLMTLEYVIVPMVFRSLKIADELASSCIVRGIESPYKKQGYYINPMRISDGLLMVGTVAVSIIFIIL